MHQPRRAGPPSPPAPHRSWWAAPAAAGGLLTTLFFTLPSGGLTQTLLLTVASFAAVALLGVRLAREGLLLSRPWVFLLAGTGLYAAATPFWGVLPVAAGTVVPFPSPLDGLYFASYALSGAFLVGLLRARHHDTPEARRAAVVALLDAGIFAIATTAVLWPALIGPSLADPDMAGLTKLVAVSYPLLTAMLVGLVARLALTGRRWAPAKSLLLVWALGELSGDIFYGFLSATGAFHYGHVISAAWLLSYVALGALARHPGLVQLAGNREEVALQGARLWMPLGAVILPLAVALFTSSVLLQVIAIVGVGLVITRLRLVSGDLAEQRRLTADLVALTVRLEHQSLHDPLTGLANRSLFAAQFEQAWAHEQRHAGGLVVLAIDLDGLKLVNDRQGHHAGDQLLMTAARRMERCIRDSDTLARLGGDEFGIVLPDADLDDARQVADRLLRELAVPLVIAGWEQHLTASIGIAVADGRQRSPDDLLRAADVAMYRAKGAGKARHETYVPGSERADHVILPDVAPSDAIAWATYVRTLRDDIALSKASGEIRLSARAPATIHRTLAQVLAAVDQLPPEAVSAVLVLPPQQVLEEFVFHQSAVQHWADTLLGGGALSTTRPPDADRFWEQLERQAGLHLRA